MFKVNNVHIRNNPAASSLVKFEVQGSCPALYKRLSPASTRHFQAKIINLQVFLRERFMVKVFEVVLKRPPAQVFFPGSKVGGDVVVEVNSCKKYHSIEVGLYGFACTRWTEGSGEHATTYSSSHTLVDSTSVVWMRDWDVNRHLPTGTHRFPFEFTLPSHLPPSFSGKYGQVEYHIQASIDAGIMRPSHSLTAPVHVVEVVNQVSVALRCPAVKRKEKTVWRLHGSPKPITLTAELPQLGYCLGDAIPLTVTVENGSGRPVKVSASLVQHIQYDGVGTYGAVGAIEVEQKIVGARSDSIQPQEESVWSPREIVVPCTVCTTMQSHVDILVWYTLKVSVLIPWARKLSTTFKLTIGNVQSSEPLTPNRTSSPCSVPTPGMEQGTPLSMKWGPPPSYLEAISH